MFNWNFSCCNLGLLALVLLLFAPEKSPALFSVRYWKIELLRNLSPLTAAPLFPTQALIASYPLRGLIPPTHL